MPASTAVSGEAIDVSGQPELRASASVFSALMVLDGSLYAVSPSE